MKKVLIILPSLAVGGMEKVLINLVNELDENKYDITIKTIYDCFELADNLKSNIKYSSFYKSSKNNNINFIKSRIYTFLLKKLSPMPGCPYSHLHKTLQNIFHIFVCY